MFDPGVPNITVVRELDGGGAGVGGAGFDAGAPNIMVWFFAGGGAAAAGVPNIMVLLADAARAGGGAGSAPGLRAVKTCPQRVHWTGAPCGGISASSSTYVVEHFSQEICTHELLPHPCVTDP